MAYTQADIDTLKAAIATGARKVAFGSGPDRRETEFRSLADMKQLLADMQNEVSPGSVGDMRTVGQFHRGLCG